MPLLARDIIRRLNNQQITTLQGLRDAVRAVAPGAPSRCRFSAKDD